jgi:hypothetical protein
MQINATFLVQIVNFWISYAMLHKLLFKPFVHLIEKKRSARNRVSEGLKHKEHTLLGLQEEKKTNQETFRAYIKSTYVFLHPKPQEIQIIGSFEKNQQEIDHLIKITKEQIVQKVPHAY